MSIFAISSFSCASSLKKRVVAQSNELPKWCEKIEFKNWTTLTPQNARFLFINHSKLVLNQYLWAEVLKDKPSTEVLLLINFLSNYQSTENEHSYYTLIASAINLKIPLYEVLENWNENKNKIKLVKINAALPELCSTYEKVAKEK